MKITHSIFGSIALTLVGLAIASAQDKPDTASQRIEESKFVQLGGIEQWITIRGERGNPVLLFLHGGPAEAQSSLVATYAKWEKDFVVVQWDQRGAGKTFGRNGKTTPDMTLSRMTDDTIELAEYLRTYLHANKIVLLGHSWGSYLGMHAIKKRPELFAAFVGTGQVESWQRTVAIQYEYTLSRARAANNTEVVAELTTLGPPPFKDLQQYMVMRRRLGPYLAPSDATWPAKQYAAFGQALAAQDLQDMQAAGQFSLAALAPVVFAMDLPAMGNRFEVPIIVIQGADDYITPTPAAKEYLASIEAPAKQFVLIEGAGHFAAMTHTQEFTDALVNYVKPFASPAKSTKK